MIPCSLRTLGECPAPCVDRCAVQPPKAQEAPALIATWKMHLTTVTAGLVVYGFVFLAMSAWNEQLRTENRTNQEVTHHAYR